MNNFVHLKLASIQELSTQDLFVSICIQFLFVAVTFLNNVTIIVFYSCSYKIQLQLNAANGEICESHHYATMICMIGRTLDNATARGSELKHSCTHFVWAALPLAMQILFKSFTVRAFHTNQVKKSRKKEEEKIELRISLN